MTLADALVYVIDDDMSMRRAIGRLLESEDYSVELFTGAREFLARAPHTGPSCVILDLNMPGLNGLELQETLVGRGRAERFFFITGGASVPTCVQAMKAGAVDYLPKPFRNEDLLCAVERALERSSKQWLQRSQCKEVRDRLATLTPREFDVLKCVIAGMLNKQIASQLGTTEGTTKVHRGRVMEKMGARSWRSSWSSRRGRGSHRPRRMLLRSNIHARSERVAL
jgi:FixJ family two-component response regulator